MSKYQFTEDLVDQNSDTLLSFTQLLVLIRNKVDQIFMLHILLLA